MGVFQHFWQWRKLLLLLITYTNMWGSRVWSRLKYAADLSVSCQRRVVTNSDVVWHRSCATLISMLRHVCRNKRRLRSTRIAFRSWCTTRSSRSGSKRPRPPKRKNSNDTRYVLERHTVRTRTTSGTYSNYTRILLRSLYANMSDCRKNKKKAKFRN